MRYKTLVSAALVAATFHACGNRTNQTTHSANNNNEMEEHASGSFGYDLSFLKQKDSVIVLKNKSGKGQLIVSPKYQAKVFTSTANGESGTSFGWINYEAFDKTDEHMNAYGGENRLWLGPEGGKFSLYFKPGAKMEYENWHTPAAIDVEAWRVDQASEQRVTLSKETELTNYAGTALSIKLDRQIEILENADIQEVLDIQLTDDVNAVGFKTTNTIHNMGQHAWDRSTGAPCLWSLDMFTPSPKTTIIIPYREEATGKVATTDYFGEIPQDRIDYKDGILRFKADGKSRGKLGVPPQRVKPVAGSYAADTKVLTIIYFDVDPKGIYLNQEWTPDKDPFTGDAMNAYNDGPLEDGSQMGPFYEMESVSPAAFLKPKEQLNHKHYVFHFTGNEEQLDKIAKKVLGVSLKEAQFN